MKKFINSDTLIESLGLFFGIVAVTIFLLAPFYIGWHIDGFLRSREQLEEKKIIKTQILEVFQNFNYGLLETDLNKSKGVILDEADRLLDMGFKDDITYIISKMPTDRQIMMFSATDNIDLMTIAYRFHSQPEEIKLNTDQLIVDGINHTLIHMARTEKMPYLVGLLRDRPDAYAIIFCNTWIISKQGGHGQ